MTLSRRAFGRNLLATALLMQGFGLSRAFAADPQRAIVYNCPAEWAGWGSMLPIIKAETGIEVPMDNKNSGQSVSQIIAEANNPVADAAYLGISFAINAKNQGLVENYKGEGWQKVPAGLKDPDGAWVSIHAGTVGLMVNTEALDGLPVPKGWKDLLDPKYEGMVGFLDPSSAFVGYACSVAVNHALGGTLDDFGPALDYFKKLNELSPIVPKQTAYARCLSGEIPILFDYDFDAYRAKYADGAPIEFVIPVEGTIQVPYVMTLVKNAPHAENGRRVIDFVLSEKGQKHWAENFLRPVVGDLEKLAPEAAKKFLPASEYERAGSVDYARMAEVQRAFSEAYLQAMKADLPLKEAAARPSSGGFGVSGPSNETNPSPLSPSRPHGFARLLRAPRAAASPRFGLDRPRDSALRGNPHQSALRFEPLFHRRPLASRHDRVRRARRLHGDLFGTQRLPRPQRRGGTHHAPAFLPGRRRGLHDHHAGRPKRHGLDPLLFLGRGKTRLRLRHGGALLRLPLLLDSPRRHDRHGGDPKDEPRL